MKRSKFVLIKGSEKNTMVKKCIRKCVGAHLLEIKSINDVGNPPFLRVTKVVADHGFEFSGE